MDLSSLSRQDLQRLLGSSLHPSASDAAFQEWFETLPQVAATRQHERELRDKAESLAEQNLALKPALEKLRSDTQAAYDRAKALEQEWPVVEAAQREAYKRFAPSSLHALLTQSASKLHDESERLASAYVEGLPLEAASSEEMRSSPPTGANTPVGTKLDPDTAFVRRYLNLRTAYHRRNILAERWGRGTVTWRDE